MASTRAQAGERQPFGDLDSGVRIAAPFVVRIEPIREDHATPHVLLKRIWQYVDTLIRLRVTRPAYRRVLADYLPEQAALGMAGEWPRDRNALVLRFPGAGSLEAYAASHWVRLGFGAMLDPIDDCAAHCGFRILAPRDSVADILRIPPRQVLAEVRGSLCVVAAPNDELTLLGHPETPTSSELTEDERKQLRAIVRAGECRCQLCGYLRRATEETVQESLHAT